MTRLKDCAEVGEQNRTLPPATASLMPRGSALVGSRRCAADGGYLAGVRSSDAMEAEPTSKREYLLSLLWQHKHTTVTLCAVFWSFGMCVAFLGPTLLDLGCKTQTVFSTMSWVFFSQSLFILLGAAAAGAILIQKLTANITLLLGTAVMAVTMALIPMCNLLAALAVVLALMGFSMGTIDTVANVYMLRIYGSDVSPFLQALHFFYGIGAFVSPMIAQPFLLNEDCSAFIDNGSDPLDADYVGDRGLAALPAASLEEAQKKTHINYAFWIMALLMVPVVILASSLVAKQMCRRGNAVDDSPGKAFYENMDDKVPATGNEIPGCKPQSTAQVVVNTLLTAAIMFLYDGLQAVYGGYIYSYAVKGPTRLPRSDAAYLNALFWGMFAAGRLVSIVLATRLSPSVMLFCNITGCTVGTVLMLCVPWSKTVLILGTLLLGSFMSSVFPTALSLIERRIHVTPKITSTLVFGAALGEMSMPVIVGHEFHREGPMAFLVICLVLCVLSCLVFTVLWLLGQGGGSLPFWNNLLHRGAGRGGEADGAGGGEEAGLMTQHVRYYSRMRSDQSDNSVGEREHESSLTEPNLALPQ